MIKKFESAKELINFIESQKRITPKTDLSKMDAICASFDHPERKFKSIHVTGTNGKGSVVAFLNRIFQDRSLNVGCFTSPYITCFNERIRFNDCFIEDDTLLSIGNRIMEKYPEWEKEGIGTPSFFEFITLLAFIYFSEIKNLDLAIIEVGIGGRLDSTNVINSTISVITNVSYDHTEILGGSLQAILKEKLGIVKDDSILIANLPDTDLKKIASDICDKHHSKIKFLEKEEIKILSCDLNGTIFCYKDYENVKISMIGYHQVENAILALIVATEYFKIIKLDNKKNNVLLYKSLLMTNWLGRFEIISNNPLLIVDGAHNVDGITRITNFIRNLKDINQKRAVVAISDNKDKARMVELLDETFDEIIFTEFHYTRSSLGTTIYEMSKNPNKMLLLDLDKIIEYVYQEKMELTIFIGSLYFVSEVRKVLKNPLN